MALAQYIVIGLLNGGLYALIALGIVLIYKSTEVFNFLTGAMMVFGAYIAWTLLTLAALPIWLSILLALVCGAVLGFAIERLLMRPMIGQPILSAIMVLLAFTFVLEGATVGIWTIHQHAFPDIFPGGSGKVGDIAISYDLLYCAIAALAIFGLSSAFYRWSRWGLLMRATAEDHQIAQARGIRVGNIFSLTWAIGGMILTVAGILVAVRLDVGIGLAVVAFSAFPAVMLGGLNSIPGALVGGLVVGVCESLAGAYISSWVMAISPYIVVLLVLVFLPHGLFGLKRIERI